jgi:inorganic phosphate transporter, PiT family
LVGPGIAFLFAFLAAIFAALLFRQTSDTMIGLVAAALGAWMALNIGANDVANKCEQEGAGSRRGSS